MSALDEYAYGESRCPACGDRIDFCNGHGPLGDRARWVILQQHEADNHDDCHRDGCAQAGVIITAMLRGETPELALARLRREQIEQCMRDHPAGKRLP